MLVLSRKAGEQILIGKQIAISVVDIQGSRVRLGIDAPHAVNIVRAELAGRPAPRARAAPRRILIVDDNPDDRLLVRRCLALARPRFEFAETGLGEQGLRLCRDQPPDCVLLDYQLPDLNGLEFLGALRRDNAGRTIPVILFTGQGCEAVAVAAMKKGARDYLVKREMSPAVLQQAVHDAIGVPYVN